MQFFLAYIFVIIPMVVLDYLWLGVITKDYYKAHIGHLFAEQVLWYPIVLFYLIYAVAVVHFVVLPAEGMWLKALLGGAFLGLIAYMTYDLVNLATLKDWPLTTAIVDILWGIFITATAATVSTLLLNTFGS